MGLENGRKHQQYPDISRHLGSNQPYWRYHSVDRLMGVSRDTEPTVMMWVDLNIWDGMEMGGQIVAIFRCS